MRRVYTHWLLACLLVFAQEAAVVHLSEHAAERFGNGQSTTHTGDSICTKCSLFASFGNSPPANALVFKLALTQREHFDTAAFSLETRTVVHYQSRAPPVLI